MIHVCYGLRDESGRYSKYAGTSIQSVLDNTNEEVTIHIIHDSTLSDDNRRKLTIIVYQHNQEIRFYNVEELVSDKIELASKKLPRAKTFWGTMGALYRTLIPKFLDSDRAIYLDTDILVNLDIKSLWQIDLRDKILGATPQSQDYFNSGVLLMDLSQLRKLGGGGHILYSKVA